MGLFSRLRGKPKIETKSASADALDELLKSILLFGGATNSGTHVSPETAMRCASVYACVRVLSEDVSQLPFNICQHRRDGGSDVLYDHPLYRLVHNAPNDWQTSFEFREMMMGHLLLRGNAYAFINWIGRGESARVAELLPLHPDSVAVNQKPDFSLWYNVTLGDKVKTNVPASNILHLRGLSLNGYQGLTPIGYMRESIGLALATEKFGAQLFKNGARPGGLLKHPGKISKEAAARLKEAWTEAYTGDNAHKTAVLEEGMEWQSIGLTSEDSQFLETRRFQRSEIAAIFRVPPHKIGDLDRATFSNIEHQSMEYVSSSLMPWLVRFEQSYWRDLLTRAEQNRGLYFNFVPEGLLRGDLLARYQAYQMGITNGILNPNEARAKENMNPREGGDEYLKPMNMEGSKRPGDKEKNGGKDAKSVLRRL